MSQCSASQHRQPVTHEPLAGTNHHSASCKGAGCGVRRCRRVYAAEAENKQLGASRVFENNLAWLPAHIKRSTHPPATIACHTCQSLPSRRTMTHRQPLPSSSSRSASTAAARGCYTPKEAVVGNRRQAMATRLHGSAWYPSHPSHPACGPLGKRPCDMTKLSCSSAACRTPTALASGSDCDPFRRKLDHSSLQPPPAPGRQHSQHDACTISAAPLSQPSGPRYCRAGVRCAAVHLFVMSLLLPEPGA